MKNLDEIANRMQTRLDEKDTVREIAIKSSRAVIRLSSGIVHAIHRREDVGDLYSEALDEVHRLRSLLDDYPDIWGSGLVGDALAEMAEASILMSVADSRDLPDPDELNIPMGAYLMGFADSIGELRRFSLEALRSGDIDAATEYLEMMEDMFMVLMRFDYPDALVAIRRKQDIARSVLEKTRGEVAVAVNSKQLQDKIVELFRKL
jgi:translin